jgi:hypothetical protein
MYANVTSVVVEGILCRKFEGGGQNGAQTTSIGFGAFVIYVRRTDHSIPVWQRKIRS